MAAKYHSGELCNECFLCGSKYKHYDHYKTFRDEEKQFVAKHLGEHPPDSSCICKADHIEASKHHRDVDHIPRWKREDNNECIV